MEDRLTVLEGRERLALAALAAIVVVTVAWWLLALWPLPDTSPEWLARTREVCFGAARDGLPHAGGWVLLVGEPAGMLLFLLAAWGDAVHGGVMTLWRRWSGRAVLVGTASALTLGLVAVTARVASARGERFDPMEATGGVLVELNDPAPALTLVNQQGATVSLAALRGRPVVVTFAFAHCQTICPTLVQDVLRARRLAPRPTEVLVVTLDPWRDTPSRLPTIAAGWQLPPDVHVLSGPVEEVEATLTRWKIPRVRNQSTGDLIHPAVVYVVDEQGRLAFQTGGGEEEISRALARL
ncbi:MAG: SCO family protein [Gemmatimonadales bacterium]|jgi:protein SCO1/2|nr:SCO family protein [Gemmatimonadales bacterium]